MPSRIRKVLSLGDGQAPYIGRAAEVVLLDYMRHYGFKIDATVKGKPFYGAIIAGLKASMVLPGVKLQYFRENRFQNPNRSEYAALTRSTKLKKKVPAPRRNRPRWADPARWNEPAQVAMQDVAEEANQPFGQVPIQAATEQVFGGWQVLGGDAVAPNPVGGAAVVGGRIRRW